MIFEKAASRVSRPAPSPDWLMPLVAADPMLAAWAPAVLGLFLGGGMSLSGLNGLTNKNEMEYGYGFGHLLKFISGIGLAGYGVGTHAAALDIIGPTAEWAPISAQASVPELAAFISEQSTYIIVAALALSILGWLTTGGIGRALDTPAAIARDRKRCLE